MDLQSFLRGHRSPVCREALRIFRDRGRIAKPSGVAAASVGLQYWCIIRMPTDAPMSPLSTSPTPTDLPTCPHGPRAGTTTCLYCRNEARAAARQRRNRVITRFSLVALGAVAVVALIVGAVTSLVPGRGGDGTADGLADQSAAGAVTGAGGAPTAGPRPSSLVLEPSIPEGRSTLGDSIVAERRGGDVTVHFDTEALRTRYDWKFEGVVRATLPIVFGADVRVALDSIRTGDFVRGGDLFSELPTRGIRLALSGGRSLTVRPITRAGENGPLVVGYRASAGRN